MRTTVLMVNTERAEVFDFPDGGMNPFSDSSENAKGSAAPTRRAPVQTVCRSAIIFENNSSKGAITGRRKSAWPDIWMTWKAATSVRPVAKQVAGGIDAVTPTCKANVYDDDRRSAPLRHFESFLRCGGHPGDAEAGVRQCGLRLHCDQEVVFDDQNAVRLVDLSGFFLTLRVASLLAGTFRPR
jgi:hypothetical protein